MKKYIVVKSPINNTDKYLGFFFDLSEHSEEEITEGFPLVIGYADLKKDAQEMLKRELDVVDV